MSSWYSTLRSTYANVQPSPFCDDKRYTFEFAMRLGSTWTGAGAPPFTAVTGAGGLLATCALRLRLGVAFMDVSDADGAVTEEGEVQHVSVTVPLATCSALNLSGPSDLLLFTCVDLAPLLASAPSAAAGATRVLASKGLLGASLVPTATNATGTIALNTGETATGTSACMQVLDTGTNCFPDNSDYSLAACGESQAVVYADAAYDSTAVRCLNQNASGVPCGKWFAAAAPTRFLLFLNVVSPSSYVGGAWTAGAGRRTLYWTHASTRGAVIADSAPCYPFPVCGTAAADDGAPAWLVVLLVVAAAIVLGVVVAAAALGHSVHKPLRDLAAQKGAEAHDLLRHHHPAAHTSFP